MIYITGDTHATIDWEKINTTRFPEQRDLTKSDYLIILGDFGGVWDGGKQDRYVSKSYNSRNFTTLFIDGNHENHYLLDGFPGKEWNGGKVHYISDSVIHLMRGQVYTIDGIRFFTMGGAESIDKIYRMEGVSWWARELPSYEEYEEALINLEKVNYEVDVVLTHCAPEGYLGNQMTGISDRYSNSLTRFLDELITEHGLKFGHWYFGHYHMDMDLDEFSVLYDRMMRIKDKT